MKKNKNVFPFLFLIIAALCILAFGCGDKTIGEELCSLGCSRVGGKFYWQLDHTCYCSFEMPHFHENGQTSSIQDTPSKFSKTFEQTETSTPPGSRGSMVSR